MRKFHGFILFSLLSLSACERAGLSLGQKIVVDVNGKQMTANMFAQELAYRLRDQDALTARDPKFSGVVKAKIVEDFVTQALTESWAQENGVLVKAEDLEKQIKNIQSSYPDDLAFQQALIDQGINFKAWKDRLQDTLLQKQVIRSFAEKMTSPTDADMQAYYNQNKSEFIAPVTAQVRQVLVATESDAKAIQDELKRGKRMTDLAKKYSISPEGPSGGDVGWLEKGLTEVFEPAFQMKIGSRSPIIKSSFGYHIFELLARKPSRTKPYTEVKEQIKHTLLEKREQAFYQSWLEEQVRKARVFKDQDFIDAMKVETKIK